MTEDEKSSQLYRIVRTRVDAYEIMRDSLESDKQLAPLRILDQCTGADSWLKFGTIEFNENMVLGAGNCNTVVFSGRMEYRPVAVKRIKYKQRNQNYGLMEIQILKCLPTHSNIVQFFHAEIVPRKFVLIALELCTNSLQDCVDEKRFPISKNEILEQVTTGLNFLHRNNVIHRDLKPANILMAVGEKQTSVKLTDFGLSKVLNGSRATTGQTICVGTKCWMPPEVLRYRDEVLKDKEAKLVRSL